MNTETTTTPPALAAQAGSERVICVHDNPRSMARECWQNGIMICSYTAEMLCKRSDQLESQPFPSRIFSMAANVGEWKPGQLIGNPSAIPNTHYAGDNYGERK